MVSHCRQSSLLSTQYKFISVCPNGTKNNFLAIKFIFLVLYDIFISFIAKLLDPRWLLCKNIWRHLSMSWTWAEKILLKTAINTLDFIDIYVRFMCKTLHKSSLLSVNINWVHYSWESKPPRPITDSRFSIFSFVRSKYLSKWRDT